MTQSTISPTKPGLIRRALIAILFLGVLGAFALSSLNLVAGESWLADTFVHFRIQYLLAGLTGLLLMVWHRKTAIAILSTLVIAMNIVPVMTYFAVPGIGQAHAGQASTTIGASHETFRIASANLHSRNDSYAAVVHWIRQERPDFVALIEVRRPWNVEMRNRLPEYPYQRMEALGRRSGKLLLSKLPFESYQSLNEVGARSKTPLVTLQRNNARVRIAGLHLNWPMRPAWAANRNSELVRLAKLARQNGPPMVAMGDFNITQFSRHFQQLEKDGDLRRASAGRGWLHSWPTFFMPAGIQIDHIMIASSIQVLDFKTGAGLNSDHKWVMADIRVPIQAP